MAVNRIHSIKLHGPTSSSTALCGMRFVFGKMQQHIDMSVCGNKPDYSSLAGTLRILVLDLRATLWEHKAALLYCDDFSYSEYHPT